MDLSTGDMIIIALLVTILTAVVTIGAFFYVNVRRLWAFVTGGRLLGGGGRGGAVRRNNGAGAEAADAAAAADGDEVGGAAAAAAAPLLSPASTREEIEAFAQQMRSSAANRRAAASGAAANNSGTAPTAATADEFECSICLCEAEAAVEFLPCGHFFCGRCAQQLWQHGGVLRQMRCPLDRAVVEAMVPAFRAREAFEERRRRREGGNTADDGAAAANVPLTAAEVRAIDADLARYNARNPRRTIAGVLSLASRAFSMARFLPLLVKLRVALLFVLPFLYTVSPIDAIPELVFGIAGYLDDAVVVLLAVIALAGVARSALGGGGGGGPN